MPRKRNPRHLDMRLCVPSLSERVDSKRAEAQAQEATCSPLRWSELLRSIDFRLCSNSDWIVLSWERL